MHKSKSIEREPFAWLPIIGALFSSSLLIANTLDSKIIAVGSLTFPAGITVFPIAYLFGDLLTEVYGFRVSKSVIWVGFASLGLMAILYSLVAKLPPAPYWHEQRSYDAILGRVPRIVAASMLAYLVGEIANSYVLSKLKRRMRGRAIAFRFVTSTAIGQAIDTAIFCVVAFGGVLPSKSLPSLFASAWVFKVVWEIIALPLTLPLVQFLKRVEREDHYDSDEELRLFSL